MEPHLRAGLYVLVAGGWASPTVRDTTAGRSLIGALVALSPVASRRVLGRWAPHDSCRISADLADVAMTQREPGMRRRPCATDTITVPDHTAVRTDLRAVSGRQAGSLQARAGARPP